MAPRSEFRGSAGLNPLPGLNPLTKCGDTWLEGKRKDDGVGMYWRIHDDLYDFTEFVKIHPGGSQWLEMTKGTDITEAFEVHHIQETPFKLLPKYHVKKADTPRICPYTFHEDGFYMTLKRRVRPMIKNFPKKTVNLSALYTDSFLVLMLTFSLLSCRYWNYFLGAVGGVFLSCLTVAAHNYFHQKDNLRMYYFNFSFLNYREWRISHVLSHHLYTNTVIDMEMLFFQPFMEYFPIKKNIVLKYLSWIYAPIFWALLFHVSVIARILNSIISKNVKTFQVSDLIPYITPSIMYIFGGQNFIHTIGMWSFVVAVGSFNFGLVGLNAGHHHPDLFHDGDAPREEKDWGLIQLDAVMDRNDITGSHLLVLTTFGDHGLHHLFPTLDQGVLDEIYPVFKKTMEEFHTDLRMSSQLESIRGQFMQLSRSIPNNTPPTSENVKNM